MRIFGIAVVLSMLLMTGGAFAQPAASEETDNADLYLRILLSMLFYSPDDPDAPQAAFEPHDPWAALDKAEVWQLSDTKIDVPYGTLSISTGTAIRPGGIEFSQYVLAGEMTLTLTGLPALNEDTLNVFDFRAPGRPVEFAVNCIFLCGGSESALSDCAAFRRPGLGQWDRLDEATQQTLADAYLRSYHNCGWLDPYYTEPSEEMEKLPASLWPDCGYPLPPEPGEALLAWRTPEDERWELQDKPGELTLSNRTRHDVEYVQSPRRRGLFEQEAVPARNYTITNLIYDTYYKEGDPGNWVDNPNVWEVQYACDLAVDEPQAELHFSLPRFWSCESITDGLGNEMSWEEVETTVCQPNDLVVHGSFQPGHDYRIVINQRANGMLSFGDQGPNIYSFPLRLTPRAADKLPSVTIRVRIEPGGLQYVASDGAEESTDGESFTATWPGGYARHCVIGHRLEPGIHQHRGVMLYYAAPSELLGTPVMTENLSSLCKWLELRREVLGPWFPEDGNKYLVLIDPDSESVDAAWPDPIRLGLIEEPLSYKRFRNLTYGNLADQPQWFTNEPECWRDALLNLLVYKADQRFAEEFGADRAENDRQSAYRLLAGRQMPGRAEDLLALGLSRHVEYRVRATLIALDHLAGNDLYTEVIHPLQEQALAQGELSFAEISAAFLSQADTPLADWWQKVVLEGELPADSDATDPALPAQTPEQQAEAADDNLRRLAAYAALDGDPYGAMYLFEQRSKPYSGDRLEWFWVDVLDQLGRYEDALAAIELFKQTNAEQPRYALRFAARRPALMFKLGRYDEALAAIDEALGREYPSGSEWIVEELELLKELINENTPGAR
ncbi:hypothetical protein JW859_03035 [bacterium]|nr:hypothetical protein [bacterium]